MLNRFYIEEHVKKALQEDIDFEDITTDNLTDDTDTMKCYLNTREDGVFCGKDVFDTVFKVLTDNISIKFFFKDGDVIKKGDKLAEISGSARAILTAERTALNYVQRLSGIATKSRQFQDAIREYGVRMVDTRKTTPNFRIFEKYAVKVGSGYVHRFNLSDLAMVKDNHVRFAGSITNAVKKLKQNISHAHKIEVECDTLEQVKEALSCEADIIMLDLKKPNMQPENNIVKNIVYAGSKRNVKMTMVNGKILYENGAFSIGFSEEEIYRRANEIINRIKG